MRRLLVATHGYMAKGIKSALSIVVDNIDHVIDVNAFTEECPNPEVVVAKLLEQYKDEELVVLTDVYFGGVNQIFLKARQERHFPLITGASLPLAVELCVNLQQELSDELLEQIVEQCRRETKVVPAAYGKGAKCSGIQCRDEEEEM